MQLTELQKGHSLNTRKIVKFAEGLSQEEALFRPYDAVNNFLWNLGNWQDQFHKEVKFGKTSNG